MSRPERRADEPRRRQRCGGAHRSGSRSCSRWCARGRGRRRAARSGRRRGGRRAGRRPPARSRCWPGRCWSAPPPRGRAARFTASRLLGTVESPNTTGHAERPGLAPGSGCPRRAPAPPPAGRRPPVARGPRGRRSRARRARRGRASGSRAGAQATARCAGLTSRLVSISVEDGHERGADDHQHDGPHPQPVRLVAEVEVAETDRRQRLGREVRRVEDAHVPHRIVGAVADLQQQDREQRDPEQHATASIRIAPLGLGDEARARSGAASPAAPAAAAPSGAARACGRLRCSRSSAVAITNTRSPATTCRSRPGQTCMSAVRVEPARPRSARGRRRGSRSVASRPAVSSRSSNGSPPMSQRPGA